MVELKVINGGNGTEIKAREALTAIVMGDATKAKDIIQGMPSPPSLISIATSTSREIPEENESRIE